ncbi:hypothetical protein F2P56_013298, partial [Juglans regia]
KLFLLFNFFGYFQSFLFCNFVHTFSLISCSKNSFSYVDVLYLCRCIPYRYRKTNQSSSVEDIEVLVVSSQKSQAMMFPKGGWEEDESKEVAARRETLEEAGVDGKVQKMLGKWNYKSKRHGKMHEGYMFPLLVTKQLDIWPEKNLRERRWMSVKEAREVCQQGWMKEALDRLVSRQSTIAT